MKRQILTAITAASLALGSAHAVTIGWNFSDLNATFDTGTATDFTVSDITIGNTLGNVSSPVNSSSGSNVYAGATGSGNIGNAVKTGAFSPTSSSYYQVTFTPTAGFQLDITDFDFGMRSTATGSQSYALYASIDGFTTAIFQGSSANNSVWSLKNNAAFDLEASAGTPITLRLYTFSGTGNAQSGTENNRIDDVSITLSAASAGPTNNDSVITTGANTISVNRVMKDSSVSQNVALSKAGTSVGTFSATVDGSATTTTPSGSIVGSTGSVNVGLDTSSTGSKTGNVTVANTATSSNGAGQGNQDPNDVIAVSGTVVDNRTVTANSVNLGKVFVGATATGTTTLTTTGADDQFTRITTSGSAVSTNGVTIAASGSTTFNSATVTADRTVSGNFTTSGAKNVTANIGVTGEGLAGENAQQNVAVNTTADVYERAALTTNNSSALDDGATVTIDNAIADGTQRASAQVASKTVTSDWSVAGLDAGTDIAENSEAAGTVSFNSAGKLNGTHVGSLVIGFRYSDSTIQGAGAAAELANQTWTFSHTVTGNVATNGSAGVDAGGSLAGLGLISASAAGTQATLLAGTSSSSTTVTIDFSSINPEAANDASRISDVVTLNGTNSDVVVFQLTYNPADLGSLDVNDLRLAEFVDGQWELISTGSFVLGAWDPSAALGTYGLDTATDTVWGVVNHDGEFGVVANPTAVPEPGTYALLALAGVLFVIFRRRKIAA